MIGKLILEDGSQFDGISFAAKKSITGEVVFSTGMAGYPESFTDPSYSGQILILTYPLVGSYGVPNKKFFESPKIHIAGLVVSTYIDTPSHFQSVMTLGKWLENESIPALIIKDTRFLTQKIRTKGVMLGKIIFDKDIPLNDPNTENLVAKVSTKKITIDGFGKKTILLYDCGAKKNIKQALLKRGVQVITVPWDYDPYKNVTLSKAKDIRDSSAGFTLSISNVPQNDIPRFDAVVISNGPGDPKMADKTIHVIRKFLENKIPILGICLGNQLLALAAGGDTGKLKFGHRSQNQPCLLEGSKRCYITTQNHGFHVSKIPPGFKPWFTNANDGSNEGIMHEKLPFMSVQFHPEACPGPTDTEWIFDYFLKRV